MFNRNFYAKIDSYLLLIFLGIFSLVACYFERKLIIPAIIMMGICYLYCSRNIESRTVRMSNDMDNIIRNIERVNHYAVRRMDVAIAVFNNNGVLQWHNELFKEITGGKALQGARIEELLALKENTYDILTVKDGERTIHLGEKYYRLKHYRIETQDTSKKTVDNYRDNGLMVFLTDITTYVLLKEKYENNRLCLVSVRFDNYDEVTRGLSDAAIANVNGEVGDILTKWVQQYDGFISRMNKETALVGFSYAALLRIMDDKFSVLNQFKEIHGGNKIAPTCSMGVSCDGENLTELIGGARKNLEDALKRGGDQAIVLANKKLSYFGGTGSVTASTSRVKARMVAQFIREKLQEADTVFVMGHNNEDYDAIGAAIGVLKLSHSLGKPSFWVTSGMNESFNKIVEVMESRENQLSTNDIMFMDFMVTGEQALTKVTPKSLLIMVDHHRLALSASKELVQAVNSRIIIDHHRRAEDIISNTVLTYLEPSASSSSEMITELVAYFDDQNDFTPAEATALYAGICLDTKNFAVQTSERTFEAAALLLRYGAKLSKVRNLFEDDMEEVKQRARLLAEARVPINGMALTLLKNANKDARSSILAAQAADRLVTIHGIHASFAVVEYNDGSLGISARSDTFVNVQLIMEAFGGGGHQKVAGVQLPNTRLKDIEPKLIELTKEQLKQESEN